MSGSVSVDLYSSLINTLCTAAPGFSRDYASALSISNERCSPVMCNGNRMHAAMFMNMYGGSIRVPVYIWVGEHCSGVYFTALMTEHQTSADNLCLFYGPSPKLQHVHNKPSSSNPRTVQQSMGNYLSQSMGWAFLFLPLPTSPAVLFVSFLPAQLCSPFPSHFLLSLCFLLGFFFCTHSLHSNRPPPLLLTFPPALSAKQHLLRIATAQQLQSH